MKRALVLSVVCVLAVAWAGLARIADYARQLDQSEARAEVLEQQQAGMLAEAGQREDLSERSLRLCQQTVADERQAALQCRLLIGGKEAEYYRGVFDFCVYFSIAVGVSANRSRPLCQNAAERAHQSRWYQLPSYQYAPIQSELPLSGG